MVRCASNVLGYHALAIAAGVPDLAGARFVSRHVSQRLDMPGHDAATRLYWFVLLPQSIPVRIIVVLVPVLVFLVMMLVQSPQFIYPQK